MYEAFWHLEQAPFVVTPDVRFLLRARSHHESLSALLTGIARETGVMVLVGDVGTGKSLLCRALCAELSPDVRSVLVINPYLSGAELIGTILDDLGVARAGSTHGALMAALARHLLALGAEGQSVVVIVDEAQQMSVEALEQIRILSTIDMPGKKLLQVLLVGHPELLDKLGRRELYQLDQRVGVRCRLEPLSARDTSRYVEHRLRVAGLVGALPFTRAALVELYGATRGIPRVINLVSDRALARAFSARAEEVTPVHVKGAVRDIAPRTRPPRGALARGTAWRDGAGDIIRCAVPMRRAGAVGAAAGIAVLAAVGVLAHRSGSGPASWVRLPTMAFATLTSSPRARPDSADADANDGRHDTGHSAAVRGACGGCWAERDVGATAERIAATGGGRGDSSATHHVHSRQRWRGRSAPTRGSAAGSLGRQGIPDRLDKGLAGAGASRTSRPSQFATGSRQRGSTRSIWPTCARLACPPSWKCRSREGAGRIWRCRSTAIKRDWPRPRERRPG